MSRKILVVPTGGLRREGITSSVLSVVRAMSRDDFELHIAAVYNNEPDVLEEFRSIGCAIVETPSRRAQTVAYARFLFSLMRRERYDVIHVHGSSSVMAIELRLAQLAGIKYRIAHSHNTRSDDPKRDRLLRPLFRGSWDKALACGVDAGRWLFESSAFEVLHNGQDIDTFAFNPEKRRKMRRMLDIGDALAIGFVGNINYVKNQEYLVKTFDRILSKGANAKLFIVGEGPDRSKIERLIEELALGGRVVITGRVSNVPEILQALDVMALPSLFEGLPSVVLEWQASGLPCVVSDAVTGECAVTDLVGFLPLDAGFDAWAGRLLGIAQKFSNNDDCRARRSSAAAIRLREEGFDTESSARRLAEIYRGDDRSCQRLSNG